MYHFVPFEEIEKNKWNGAVHYAHNGNTFGYHWYLKSILKEWDAIIEDDYESVMPVMRYPVRKDIQALIPEMGPFSVNILNKTRVSTMLDMAEKHHQSAYYPLNRFVPSSTFDPDGADKTPVVQLSARATYDNLAELYDDEVKSIIEQETKDHLKLISGLKPEDIVAHGKLSNHKKNALMRMMYNAMHRGIGFSSGIREKKSGNITALSFFIYSHDTLHEVFQIPAPRDQRFIMFDLLLRNQAGKPVTIQAYEQVEPLLKMGFETKTVHRIPLSMNYFSGIKKLLDLPY